MAQPDVVTRIRGEIRERMETLRPRIDEYARLRTALEALEKAEGSAQRGARRGRPKS
jgi:hypothetical protein